MHVTLYFAIVTFTKEFACGFIIIWAYLYIYSNAINSIYCGKHLLLKIGIKPPIKIHLKYDIKIKHQHLKVDTLPHLYLEIMCGKICISHRG